MSWWVAGQLLLSVEDYKNLPMLIRRALEVVFATRILSHIVRLFAAPVAPGFLLMHYSTHPHGTGVCQ